METTENQKRFHEYYRLANQLMDVSEKDTLMEVARILAIHVGHYRLFFIRAIPFCRWGMNVLPTATNALPTSWKNFSSSSARCRPWQRIAPSLLPIASFRTQQDRGPTGHRGAGTPVCPGPFVDCWHSTYSRRFQGDFSS